MLNISLLFFIKVFNKLKGGICSLGLYIIFCLAGSVYAEGIVNINRYSAEDGLSDNRVTGIIKDKEGFIWVSTWGGINRFDGDRFVSFKSNPGDNSSLTSNRIDEVVEDKDSYFLWVKAYDNRSIYRFDKRTHVFTPLDELIKDKGFKSKRFIKILAVKDQKVWLKATDGNVVIIDDASGNVPTFYELKISNGLHTAIHFFHLDKKGFAWISNGKGLFLIKQKPDCKYTIKCYETEKGNPFRVIAEEENGDMWVAYTQKRIIKLNDLLERKADLVISTGNIHGLKLSLENRNLYCTTSKGELILVDYLGNSKVLSTTVNNSPLYNLYQDRFNCLWIESANYGIMKFDENKLVNLFPSRQYGFKPWVNNSTIFEDINNRLWISIQGYQLSFYNKKEHRIEEYVLDIKELNRVYSRIVQGVYYDPAGVLWITTDNGGLEQVILQDNFFRQSFINEDHISRSENEVRAVYVDSKDRLWIGTKSGKILCNKQSKTWLDPFGEAFKPQGGVHSIIQDSKGDFWIGTKGDGIYRVIENERGFFIKNRFLNEKQDQETRRNLVYSILEDKDGKIWVGTFGGGLVLIENRENTYSVKTGDDYFADYPIENYGRIRCLAKDQAGNIWIGSTEGLVIFNPKNQPKEDDFKVYRKQAGDMSSLGGNDVHYIYIDSKEQIWIMTSSGGLNKSIGKNPLHSLKFKNYSKKQGLPSDFLLSCIEDTQGNLWIATRNGISKFSLNNEEFQNYRYYEGLQEVILSEGASARSKSGEIVFGNVYGYLTFSPKAILSNNGGSRKENLVFTNFQVNSEDMLINQRSIVQRDINYIERVELLHHQNVIGIEFASLGRLLSNTRSFAYRLVGFDDVWRSTERQNKIVYTNLPPGEYIFQIKGLDGDMYGASMFRSLEIVILPPFWKTWWAYLIYTVLIIIILLIVRKFALDILNLRQKISIEHKLAKLKDDFFTHISHELRTPLTLMLNPTEEVLKSENLTEKGKDYLNVVVKNAKRMVRFVNQLLDLRNLHDGNQELKIQEIELINFINSNLDYFKESTGKKSLAIELLTEFPQVHIWADKDKLEVVIYNLLSNAIKYSPTGKTVSITVKYTDNKLVIEVADEGSGIEEQELEAIFNLYYEGKNRPEDGTKGSGVGLALAKKIVELHHGRIYALNRKPTGLKVIVELPMVENHFHINTPTTEEGQIAEKEVLSPSLLKENCGAVIAPNEDRKTILVIEDNDDLRRFICNELSSNFQVDFAADGEEGLKKAKEILPDLIVSDIMMPKADGIAVLKEIKRDVSTSHIPVILLSAKSSVQSQIEGLEYGADYYISKPFSIDFLRTVINNLIKRRNQLSHAILSGEKAEAEDLDKTELALTPNDQLFLEKVMAVVEEKLVDEQFNIETVAESLGVSRSVFFRKFKSLTNLAPIEFVKEMRLNKAKEMFRNGERNISVVAYAVGFNNPKYFSTCFKNQFSETPREYISSLKTEN